MSLPLVSILIPSYNARRYLGECIESALAQTYPRCEIVVVDDGSTDDSLDVAHRFETRGVQVIAQRNGGQGAALNAALAASQGQYLQYLDADDVLHPRKIEVQVERLRHADAMAIATGAWVRFRDRLPNTTFQPEPIWRDLAPTDFLVESWGGGGMMHVAAWLVPRAVAVAAGPWVESLRWASNQDGEFFTRAVLASTGCLFCAEAKSYYRTGHPSVSSWNNRRSKQATLQVLLEMAAALLRHEDSPRARAAAARNLQDFVYATYPDNRDLVSAAERRIVELGGSDLPYPAGPMTKLLVTLGGWRFARQLRLRAGQVLGI